MQKIQTQSEKDKKNRINQLLIGIVLIGIMVLATAGYSIMSADKNSGTTTVKKLDYKGITYNLGDNSYWSFNYQGVNFATTFNPNDTKDVKISLLGYNMQNYKSKVVYTAGEPNSQELVMNLDQLIASSFIQRRARACVTENCSENSPLKDCATDNIIIIQEAKNNESESIYQDGNCVYIVSTYSDQNKYIDAYLFRMLGLD